MKKAFLALSLMVIVAVPVIASSAPSLSEKLKGRLLLAVEDKGRVYYVNNDGIRYLVTKDTAQKVFEKLALGVTNQDLSQIPERKMNVATSSQNICEAKVVEKIVEKIVYRDRIVEKPVYVNNCSSANSAPETTNTSYSEYVPTYQVKDRYDGETTARARVRIVVFDKFTARKIMIKKMVFRSSEPADTQRITFDATDGSYKNGIKRGEMYLSGSNKFIYASDVSITGYPFSITFIASDLNSTIEPIMSEWELWDYTDNKPVKMQ